jgi:hypothetical protein
LDKLGNYDEFGGGAITCSFMNGLYIVMNLEVILFFELNMIKEMDGIKIFD